MKTIEEAAKEDAEKLNYSMEAKHNMCPMDFEISFKKGIAFAEEWISVEDEPLPKGETILLMYDNNPKHVVSGFADMEDRSPCPHWRGDGWIKATSWRPINRQ